ncbi:MAG TPA: IS110 family transposase [Candidatus Blautia intestinigallinarum]|nr:IS110 family transposase [Candidatus Blautia intestinigallinarum]
MSRLYPLPPAYRRQGQRCHACTDYRNTYAAFLGLAPREHSSSENVNRLGISKAGNTHLCCLLIEATKGICKGL